MSARYKITIIFTTIIIVIMFSLLVIIYLLPYSSKPYHRLIKGVAYLTIITILFICILFLVFVIRRIYLLKNRRNSNISDEKETEDKNRVVIDLNTEETNL
jgi:amino acid transporter